MLCVLGLDRIGWEAVYSDVVCEFEGALAVHIFTLYQTLLPSEHDASDRRFKNKTFYSACIHTPTYISNTTLNYHFSRKEEKAFPKTNYSLSSMLHSNTTTTSS